MKKRIAAILLACAAALQGSGISAAEDAEFRPGDEYKDGVLTEVPKEEVQSAVEAGIFYDDADDMREIGILRELGIMGAYSANNFKPQVFISRIDALECILKLVAIDFENREYTPGEGMLYDVTEDYEKKNAVYAAIENGIISGYPTNTFNPDSVLSYEEAIIMLVHALGYTEKYCSLAGGYLSGYYEIADRLNITKNVHVGNRKALTRMEFAKMLYKALSAPVASADYINGTFTVGGSGETVMLKYHNVCQDTGIVTQNNICDLNGNIVRSDNLVINGRYYHDPEGRFNRYLGYKMIFWYDNDSSDLIYAAADKNVTEKIILAADEPSCQNGVISYSSGGRSKQVKLAPEYTLIYNGTVPTADYGNDIFEIGDGKITVVSNDLGAAYSVAIIEEYNNYHIKNAAVSGENGEIYFADSGMISIDFSTSYVEVYDSSSKKSTVEDSSGKYSLSGISKNSIISVAVPYGGLERSGNNIIPRKGVCFIKIICSQNTVSGKILNKNKEDFEITLDCGTYTVAASNCFDSAWADILISEETEFMLDCMGNIAALKETDKEWHYGYIIKVYFGDDDAVNNVMMLTEGGKTGKYKLADNLRINGIRIKPIKIAQKLTESASFMGHGFEYQQPVKYKMNENDELEEFETVTAEKGVAAGYAENHLRRMETAGQRFYSESSSHALLCDAVETWRGRYFTPLKVFKVPTTETADTEKFKRVTISSGTTYRNVEMDIFDADDLKPQLAVWYDDTASEDEMGTSYSGNLAPVMFDRTTVGINDDGQPVLKIRVAQMGTVKEYWSEDLNIMNGVEKGQMIYLYGSNETYEVTKIKNLLYNGNKISPSTLPDVRDAVHTNDEYYNDFFEVYEVLGTREFVLQRGAFTDGDKRQIRATGYMASDAWMMGGVILYEEDGGKITVRNGSIDDLRSVKQYGTKRASKVVVRAYMGAGRQYVIYNFDR